MRLNYDLFYNNHMDKINVLDALDNGDLIIRDLDELDQDSYQKLPIMDLSSYGNEIVNHLKGIGSDVLNDFLNGKIKQPKDLKKAIKKETLSHFGIQIKTKKSSKGISKAKDLKSMPLSDFAVMSGILMVVNAKLGEIISREKAIVEFLEVDKQTELKANFLTLNKIVKDYHHNFDNEKFLTNRELQVLEIRRNAEHNILFYKELAEKKVKSFEKGIHMEIDKALDEIQSRMQFYRLALYIYAYSSFLDVVLLENYSTTFIDSVLEDIDSHANQYVEFYEKTSKVVRRMADKSGKSTALKGASSFTSLLGKAFANFKANKKADQMENKSKSLSEKQVSSVDDMVNKFSNNKDAGISDITSNLIQLNNIYNNQSEIIIDQEFVYIKK